MPLSKTKFLVFQQLRTFFKVVCSIKTFLNELQAVVVPSEDLFTTLLFLRNVPMGPISQSVTLHQAIKACQEETHQLIGPNREQVMKKMKCCECDPWGRADVIQPFSFQLCNLLRKMFYGNSLYISGLCFGFICRSFFSN